MRKVSHLALKPSSVIHYDVPGSSPDYKNSNSITSDTYLKEGLLLIPGLGRTDRLKTVIHNLKTMEHMLLDQSNLGWQCIIYVYAERLSDMERSEHLVSFWNETNSFDYIKSLCNVVEQPNKFVTENIRSIEPYLIENKYKYLFIVLDDCKLPDSSKDFDLKRFLHIFEYNHLTVASPLVIGANKGGGQKFREIMQRPAPPGKQGHVSVFVELFAWVVTVPAFNALWSLLCPSVNPYGWGYDIWYDRYAKKRVSGHKMGIITTMKVYHDQDFNAPGGGRTDTTDIKTKWKAMKTQEIFYKKHYKVNLHSFKMQNKTWNGVATGFLESPPSF
eukprot:gene1546-2988_t